MPGILVAAAVFAAGCDSPNDSDPCRGVGCSSHGRCYPASGAPYCFCFGGYHPDGLDCAPNDPEDPCLGVDCTDHGTCIVLAGSPECVCDPGYGHPEGYVLLCTPDGHDGPVDVPPCTPSGPELCNVADDDCDGLTDEDFNLDLDAANCGHCGNACTVRDHATEAVCILAHCDVICEPGWSNLNDDLTDGCEATCEPSVEPDETACDGRDDDCDGRTDEDWTSTAHCGDGLCERPAVCYRGETSCRPRSPPATTDATCDGIDDDCDGLTDEDASCGADADGDADVEEYSADADDAWSDVTCTSAAECDDDNPCTTDLCEAGRCRNPAVAGGVECPGGVCCSGECEVGAECCRDGDCVAPECMLGQCHRGSCSTVPASDMSLCMGGRCCGGVCRVSGNCCDDNDCADGDPCTSDRCDATFVCRTPRPPAPDGTACSGGMCCSGACVAGAECCTDDQCDCIGTAYPCDAVGGLGCETQPGCSWDPAGPCGGTGTSCDLQMSPDCAYCGCSEGSPICSGTADSCSTMDAATCWHCGCTWDPAGPCVGTPPSCASISGSSAACLAVSGCAPGLCSGHHCLYM